jgi:nucleoside-diphosphate-sugar epimerase
MKRVLVTGAAGFIGRWTLPLLAARGYDVHAVTSRTVPTDSGVHWHRTDLMDRAEVMAVFSRVRPTHLLHLAWYTEHRKFWGSTRNLQWVQASLDVLDAFQQHAGKRVVIAGTCAEYGPCDGPCRETVTPIGAETLYGTCKHALHLIAERFAAMSDLSLAWGRIFLLYGPNESPDRLVPSVIRSLLRGETARCTHGNQVRDFLHVEDVAGAFVALLDSSVAGPINIASGIPVRLRDVIAVIAREIGRTDLIQLGAILAPPGEPQSLYADANRLTAEVGWQPTYTLESGLKHTVAWWQGSTMGVARHS